MSNVARACAWPSLEDNRTYKEGRMVIRVECHHVTSINELVLQDSDGNTLVIAKCGDSIWKDQKDQEVVVEFY